MFLITPSGKNEESTHKNKKVAEQLHCNFLIACKDWFILKTK